MLCKYASSESKPTVEIATVMHDFIFLRWISIKRNICLSESRNPYMLDGEFPLWLLRHTYIKMLLLICWYLYR